MLSYFKLATATLLTFVTLSFAQDVTLTIDGTSLNYESSADIYGWQFDHDGCASGASGGASMDAGFMISCSESICLGFSLTGSFVSWGTGTLVDLGGECSTLSGFVFAGEGGSALEVELSDGGETCPISECGPGMHLMDGDSVDCYCMFDCEHTGDCDGCLDPLACNYNPNANTDDGSCEYAEENYDCEGNCTAGEDCAGECGGSAEVDECGECGGDGSSCAGSVDLQLVFSQDGACHGGDYVTYNSPTDIYGFQMDLVSYGGEYNIDGVNGGAAADAGFTTSTGNNTVLGFSFSGGFIPAGSGILFYVGGASIGGEPSVCLENIVLSGSTGNGLEADGGECVTWDCHEDVDEDCICDSSDDCIDTNNDGVCETSGCTDESACNYNSDATDDDGSCQYAGENHDCDGNCTVDVDCNGDCGGSAVEDECGECGGDGSSCATSIIDILYNTTSDIGGFQFSVDGVTVIGASGGAAADSGFTISTGESIVLAFSFSGATIPAGSGVLVQVDVQGDVNAACISDVVLSDAVGVAIDNEVTDCLTISQLEIILGCLDMAACNYNADATEDDGSCTYADENYDCDGNCTADIDCAGECGGSSDIDCAGVCDGSAEVDECGECGGDGSSCAPGVYGLSLNDDGNLDVTFDSPDTLYGFQFDVSAVTVTGAFGGAAADAGFSTSTGNNTVLGFSFSGGFIPAGSGVLTVLSFEGSGEACLSNIIVAGAGASNLDTASGDCATIDETCDSGIYDCAGVCDGTAVEDCAGDCDGSAEVDECGVCGGDGIADGACDCAGSVEDCAGECNGSAVEDDCGVCGGDGSSCAPGVYGLSLNDDGNLDVTFDSPDTLYGFQFVVSAVTVTGASGGAAADAGFSTSTGNNTVLGFSFSGGSIPAGSGVLTVLSFEGSGEACLSNIVISGAAGASLDAASGDCATIDACPSGDYDCAGVCDGAAVEDCAGDCGGTAEVDECDVCDGDGSTCGGENEPDWEDNPGAYEFTASMIAVVHHTVTGAQLDDPADILAAFDSDGNVRGVATSLYAPFGPYEGSNLWSMEIRSNSDGDAISFKYYDASEDEVLAASPGYTFTINETIGNINAPHEISAGAVTLSIDFGEGWNWFSINVIGEDMSINNVLGSLTSTELDFIKTPTQTAIYYADFGWYGTLEEVGVTGTYIINSANADNLTFAGAPADPASTPIELGVGWNWVGFIPQNDGPLGEALESITATELDFIKTPTETAIYYADFGWYGTLEAMAPTGGYILNVAEGSTLTYPNFGPDDYVSDDLSRSDERPIAISDWEVNYHDYEFNGHITMSIDSREDFHGDYIAAFVGDECRGLAERMYFPFGDSYMYSVMVYSNLADGEELRFKYYDSAIGEIVEYAETIDFTSDMIVGDGFNTFDLSREGSFSQPKTYGISEAYPNPFNPVTSFEYTLEKDGMVQVAVYDLNGRMVSELVNGYQSAGSYPVVWDANELSSGVYMVNMISGDYSTVQKVMLIK